jgi:hypothetical protein
MHGSYGNWYARLAKKKADGEPWFDRSHKIVLLIFGAFRSNKGLKNFLNEFLEISVKEVEIVVAGRWPEQEQLVYNSPRIKFINEYIPDTYIDFLIKSIDYIVLPYENYTTSGLFALAVTYGKPVLARNSLYAYREVTNGLGVIYEPGCLNKTLKLMVQDKLFDNQMIRAECLRRDWYKICQNICNSLNI